MTGHQDRPQDSNEPAPLAARTGQWEVALGGDWPGLFRAFMAHSPTGAFIKDADGRIVYLSRTLEKAFHLERRPWFGKYDAELWGPEVAAKFRKDDLAVLQSGQPMLVEDAVPHDDGLHYWTVCKFPFRSAQGELFLGGVALDQTERRRTERDLKERESRLRSLVAAIPDLVFILSRDGEFVEAYLGGAAETSLHPDQFLGKPAAAIFEPSEAARILEALQKALSSGQPTPCTVKLNIGEREQVFDARVVACDVDRALMVCRNVTESFVMTEELRRKEREIVDFIENAAVGLAWLSETGDVLWANRALLEALGLRRKEFEGHSFGEFCSETSAFRELMRKSDLELAMHDFEVTLRHRSGGIRHVVLSASNYREHGRFIHKRLFVRDITEQQKARAALIENEELFRQLTENIREVFWMYPVGERQGLYLSPAFETIWGRTIASIACDPSRWLETLHPDDRPRMKGLQLRLHPSGAFFESQYRIIRPDGSARWIRDRSFPVRDKHGCTIRVAGVAEDITERVQADEERAHQASVLSHVSRLSTVGEMMASLAHEITQPLGAVSNFTAACRQIVSDAPELQDSQLARNLAEISTQIERCSDFVRRLRSFTRGTPPVRVPCDMNQVAVESLSLIEAELRHKNVEVRTDLCALKPVVLADRPQLQQILVNLLKNAADSMDEANSPERSILLTTAVEGGQVVVSVRDTGPGFTPHALQNCFQPFFTTRKDGMGLGLPICRSIVELHGGCIHPDASVAKGARVQFSLPLHSEQT